MKRIEEVLSKYTTEADYNKFHDTVDMLCGKGVGRGSFQDYTVLVDVIQVLSIAEVIIKEQIKIEFIPLPIGNDDVQKNK